MSPLSAVSLLGLYNFSKVKLRISTKREKSDAKPKLVFLCSHMQRQRVEGI